ncbi:hypothetical protein NP493_538g01031 [Ridgeia piscesae]|uniref:Zinc finger Ran-binding domain-containing protein 2 n=1 Tax=Ridgeia piscesae TaxID=27915 RepID=A0AAD9KW84_RIDPI|nr:hypothetical protein NP493_538g01031 [Ridgeia piscesae]
MATTGKFRPSDGDWICCDPNCGNVNFSRRIKCNKCGKDKATGTEFRKGGQEIGQSMAEKSRGLFSADDWQCKTCGNVNWARRSTCNMCNAPKCGKIEHRTGFGGGYMEREEVEYVAREGSDSEYDEFGRKKKRYRKPDDEKKVAPPPPRDVDDDGEEEEDDDDVDVSKYKLDSDELHIFQDDDDDVDLSKYDLSDDSDSNTKNNKKTSRSSSSSSLSSGASDKYRGSRKRPHTQSRSR